MTRPRFCKVLRVLVALVPVLLVGATASAGSKAAQPHMQKTFTDAAGRTHKRISLINQKQRQSVAKRMNASRKATHAKKGTVAK